MIEPDTIKLLWECDAGIKMGISSIGDVLSHIHADDLRCCLSNCMAKHEELEKEIEKSLNSYDDEGKKPNPMAKGMSWIKTNAKLAMDNSDAAVADLMTDGCNMGVKSLCKYLNQYKAADESSKSIAKRLIELEEKLTIDMRTFL